ncbi:MAG: electron transfer flavoprotein subunit alpha/FixB family protein [Anaerolineae bacterium]
MSTQNVFVVAEARDATLKRVSLEVLGEATRIAEQLGGTAEAVLIGKGVAPLVGSLVAHGAAKVYLLDDDSLEAYSPETYGRALASVIQGGEPAVVLFPATAWGKDLGPRVATRLGAGLASDCTGLEVVDGRLLITRPTFAGKIIAQARISTPLQMATLRPNIFPIPAPDSSREGDVETVPVETAVARAFTAETVTAEAGRLDVAEADIIVSGGRGMKGPENYALLEELAEALGGAVGASRAAVDAGWRPHGDQVGQTGKTVNPSLYIACGISGAIQHLAGMKTSKVVVAINQDRDAPIFKVADYGIVGDLFEVIPLVIEEVRRLKAQG